MSVVVLPSANQIIRQFADFPDVDMKFADKAAFETAISTVARIPDGWMAYCIVEKNWFFADKAAGTATAFGTGEGSDGKSAYEVAVDNGFEGTEEDWLESLIGPKGDTGDPGEDGEQGPQGIQGIPGPVNIVSDLEMIAGTDDAKAATALKIKNWWTDIKSKVITFTETITFTKAPKLNSLTANRILSLDASKNIEDILQKIVPVITSSTVTNLLNNDSNWRESDNVYIGTAISTQEQTQYWKNTDYWFFLYDSGTPVRIPIGGRIDHLRGRTSTPSISAGAAAGTTPSISISGTDLGFRITLTVGTSPTTGTLATVTFNRPYGSAPFVVTSPKNTNAAALSVRPYNTTTTTTLTLSVGTALTASTQYIWDFIIAQ